MARDVVELDGLYLVRLPERPWALASDVTGAKEAGWQVVDLGAYGAVVEAAKEYADLVRPPLIDDYEWDCLKAKAGTKLKDSLARLYAEKN